MKATITKLQHMAHSTKAIEGAANTIFETKPIDDCFAYAYGFLSYNSYQIRSLGVYLLGRIAATNARALQLLQVEVSKDPSAQVQNALARVLGNYCCAIGYAKALPVLEEWLADEAPNVCRAAVAALGWCAKRSVFLKHPEAVLGLLASQKAHSSAYVRQSVGKALQQLSKHTPALVQQELTTWNLQEPYIYETYQWALPKASVPKALA